MTEYSEVSVGDTVTLRSKRHPTATLTGEVREIQPDQLNIVAHGWVSETHWEIVEYQPKPFVLPTEPGLYQGPRSTALYRLGEKSQWWTDLSGRWSVLLPEIHQYLPRDLVRLVPVSAVKEARSKVVAEIVESLIAYGAGFSAAHVKSKFGGKA